MPSKKQIDVVEDEIRRGLMMLDAGYNLEIRDIAKVALTKAWFARHQEEIEYTKCRQKNV